MPAAAPTTFTGLPQATSSAPSYMQQLMKLDPSAVTKYGGAIDAGAFGNMTPQQLATYLQSPGFNTFRPGPVPGAPSPQGGAGVAPAAAGRQSPINMGGSPVTRPAASPAAGVAGLVNNGNMNSNLLQQILSRGGQSQAPQTTQRAMPQAGNINAQGATNMPGTGQSSLPPQLMQMLQNPQFLQALMRMFQGGGMGGGGGQLAGGNL